MSRTATNAGTGTVSADSRWRQDAEAWRAQRNGWAKIEAWPRAALIREYVAAVQREAESRGVEAVSQCAAWGEWAIQVAGEMDPTESRICANA